MVEFYSENEFILENPKAVTGWISDVIAKEGCEEGEVVYIFCDDAYLHRLNLQFLNHDTLTDIISFDNSLGKQLHGEIYISIDRVRENAKEFSATFEDELHRVIIHGVLHFCGFRDKSESEQKLMSKKENQALALRNWT